MRSLDERVAEINRRSERIIQLRKKRRKWALTGCVPVALCAVIFAAVAVPERQPTEGLVHGETGYYSAGVYGVVDGAMAGTVIEVTGSDLRLSHSTDASVSKILETIEHLLPSAAGTGETPQLESAVQDNGSESTACGGTGYAIDIKRADGKMQSYLLLGNKLIDCGTGEACELSKMELQILETVLGIPDEE